ncbi:MAG: hypothetical protein O9282_14830 [Flavobacterium sp.]|jgi:hypothetical protein|uniref:hypothetical protein n=1 Tax=Flavobacterium sp. TaxID=239 RepID=UPI0022CAA4F7|nr:hypothetical protein [Flavobacterium sp.]MCZ8023864.1 hypothetical protein [Cytophagales bacterium]MCZ8332582.1 hypothetical protein [Flavobacterium sp.]
MNKRIIQLLKKIESIEEDSDFKVVTSITSIQLIGGVSKPNYQCAFNNGCSSNTGCHGNTGCSGNHECYNKDGACIGFGN